MSDKKFLDSNIVIYLFDKDKEKKETVIQLIREQPIISSQVVIECLNVSIRKLKTSQKICFTNAEFLMQKTEFMVINSEVIRHSFLISASYGYSHLDSLIIASALNADCTVLYSEDLQHNQVIDKKLRIINPFLK